METFKDSKVNEWQDWGNLTPGKTKKLYKEVNKNRILGSATNFYIAVKDWIWIQPEL